MSRRQIAHALDDLYYLDYQIKSGQINRFYGLELFLINQNYDAEESRKNAENEERDKAWRFLWNDFKPSLIPDETLLEKAIEVLGINGEELEDILDWVYITDINVNTNSWQEVLKAYNENKNE